jgi:chemotaxis protein CheX
MAVRNDQQCTRLCETLDLSAAGPLAAQLLGLRGVAVTLDASRVERLGGLCLQVLLSAQAAWAADGVALSVISRSQAFDNAMALFGAHGLDNAPATSP